MSESGYLTNQLLIAMPAMGDPNFAQTVALVCDHSSRGALGLILNKPLPMRMAEIFEQLEIDLAIGPLRERMKQGVFSVADIIDAEIRRCGLRKPVLHADVDDGEPIERTEHVRNFVGIVER